MGKRQDEQGFMLLGLVVAIFLILLTLGVAAPRVAHELRRDREVETIHRGNQYVRAIQLYYRKMGHYPGSMEQLEKTNNVRFLRQRYADPMTGKDDWRLIHLGEAKTTVKGFFGQPLAGIVSSGLGSSSAAGSPTGTSSAGSSSSGTNSAFGSSPGGTGSAFGSSSNGTGSAFGSAPGSSNATSGPGGMGDSGSSGGMGGPSGTDSKDSGGPFMGVGLSKDGNSINVLNEQTTYATWEFIYDPRIEQLKAKSDLYGSGAGSTDADGLGSSSEMNPGGAKTGFGSDSGSRSPSTGSSSGSSGSSPTSPQ